MIKIERISIDNETYKLPKQIYIEDEDLQLSEFGELKLLIKILIKCLLEEEK